MIYNKNSIDEPIRFQLQINPKPLQTTRLMARRLAVLSRRGRLKIKGTSIEGAQ
jgi:hypothetical protein